jgi:hypothetical protein
MSDLTAEEALMLIRAVIRGQDLSETPNWAGAYHSIRRIVADVPVVSDFDPPHPLDCVLFQTVHDKRLGHWVVNEPGGGYAVHQSRAAAFEQAEAIVRVKRKREARKR